MVKLSKEEVFVLSMFFYYWFHINYNFAKIDTAVYIDGLFASAYVGVFEITAYIYKISCFQPLIVLKHFILFTYICTNHVWILTIIDPLDNIC